MTISYGPWPNDVFYLFFGFVPHNPWDVVVLFRQLQDMVAFHDTSQVLALPADCANMLRMKGLEFGVNLFEGR